MSNEVRTAACVFFLNIISFIQIQSKNINKSREMEDSPQAKVATDETKGKLKLVVGYNVYV